MVLINIMSGGILPQIDETLLYWRYTNADVKNIAISSSSNETDIPKVLHYNTVYFLRYTHSKYMKCFFRNLQKQ